MSLRSDVRPKINIKNLQKKIVVTTKQLRQAIFTTLSLEAIQKPIEVTVCLVDDAQIRELNLLYRGNDAPTDGSAWLEEKYEKWTLEHLISKNQIG